MTDRPIVMIGFDRSWQRAFARKLLAQTNGALSLFVAQNTPQKPMVRRVAGALRRIPPHQIPVELYCYLRTRFSSPLRETLGWTREAKPPETAPLETFVRTVEVSDVNGPETVELIRQEVPYLIVIWGGTIVRPQVLELAEYVVNIHFGHNSYYRGTHCHMHAGLTDDWEHIGVTIHYADPVVYAGDIIEIVQADTEQPPRNMFADLYQRSFERYLAVATALWKDGPVAGTPQDLSLGRQFFILEWNFRLRALQAF